MDEVLKFLAECKTFYLATVDGDQPHVRPLGVAFEYEGKIAFTTNNTKDMFKQMKANPKVEFCACKPDGQYLRVTGTVAFDKSTDAARTKALEVAPVLQNMYKVDDGIFEIFTLAGGTATFADMKGGSRTVQL